MAQPPEPTELVYPPQPSWLPAFIALGLALALVGIFGSLIVPGRAYVIVGAAIALVAAVRWYRGARQDYQRLPRHSQETSAVLPPLPPRDR